MDHHAQETTIDSDYINQFISRQNNGDASAFNQLITLLHKDLKRIAHRQFGRERINHTLQTDALINKLYIKLLASPMPKWKNHAHFLNAAARTMRQILIDHSRKWKCRADGKAGVPILDNDQYLEPITNSSRIANLLTLDKALHKLDSIDPKMAEIANLKLVLGLTLAEISKVMEMDLSKAKREWILIKKIISKTFEGHR